MLEAAAPRLTDEQGELVALLAQVCADRAFPPRFVEGLVLMFRGCLEMGWQIAWAQPELKDAFQRLWEFADSTGAELHWAQGGRQPIRGVKGLTSVREEDVRRKAIGS